MLDDQDFCDSIKQIVVNEKINIEYAVRTTADKFADMFAAMNDEYMQGRAADVRDIANKLIRTLEGTGDFSLSFPHPVILAADDLAPSETIQLDKEKILAFITRGGGVNSHTAILARMMGIPAIAGIGSKLSIDFNEKDAAIDGLTGEIFIEPDEETINRLNTKAKEEKDKKELLDIFKGWDNVTLDGQRIDIFANIGAVSDLDAVLENDAGGIGLFRSEFLYLNSDDYPSEEEQFNAYKTVAEKMAGKKVVIRTLDIGADKQIDYFNLPQEENPALGFRAIRICLERPDIFKTQLRAILRASAFGKIAIMFPMIASLQEAFDCKAILNSVKAELDAAGMSYAKDAEIGVMVETPAAVMISDLLAKEFDFCSVGTNDLTQYTLAIDRQNPKLGRFYNPRHKAILRMLKMTADNMHKEGKWIGICGELAGDLELTETFLAIGIDELSVSPPFILPIRAKICKTDVSKIKTEIFNDF
jgi:phosphotransferase system enzyme I (PtsI)